MRNNVRTLISFSITRYGNCNFWINSVVANALFDVHCATPRRVVPIKPHPISRVLPPATFRNDIDHPWSKLTASIIYKYNISGIALHSIHVFQNVFISGTIFRKVYECEQKNVAQGTPKASYLNVFVIHLLFLYNVSKIYTTTYNSFFIFTPVCVCVCALDAYSKNIL